MKKKKLTKPKPATPTREGYERTTISLPIDVKRAAQKLAIDFGVDFQDLVHAGLRRVLDDPRTKVIPRKGGK